jgi:hypothetical protein
LGTLIVISNIKSSRLFNPPSRSVCYIAVAVTVVAGPVAAAVAVVVTVVVAAAVVVVVVVAKQQ